MQTHQARNKISRNLCCAVGYGKIGIILVVGIDPCFSHLPASSFRRRWPESLWHDARQEVFQT